MTPDELTGPPTKLIAYLALMLDAGTDRQACHAPGPSGLHAEWFTSSQQTFPILTWRTTAPYG
jgi:hypothetical protein